MHSGDLRSNSFGADSDENEKEIELLSTSGYSSSSNSSGSADQMTGDWVKPAFSAARLTREHRTVWNAFRLAKGP